MFSIIEIVQLLLYVIPKGQYQSEAYVEDPGRSMVVAGTYECADAEQRVSIAPWY